MIFAFAGRMNSFFQNPVPRGRHLLGWSLVLSILLNTVFFFMVLENFTRSSRTQEELLTLELLSKEFPILNEIRRRLASEKQPGEQPLVLSISRFALPGPSGDRVRMGVADPAKDRTLREIKEDIMFRWITVTPPTWGKVVVIMEVGTDGNILNLGINHATGPPGLDRFVLNLVRDLAPFEQAMAGMDQPLWIELEFAVDTMAE